VTDNGPSFTSENFRNFLMKNGIKHVRTAPYHPASNGAAENFVRTFKDKFKLLLKSGMSRHEALHKYLFSYLTTPHCTTNVTPAELQVGRKLRTRFDILKPTVEQTVIKNQDRQKHFFRGHRAVTFETDKTVMVKDYSKNNWRSAEICEHIGPVTYNVKTDDNRIWKRHVDQIKSRNSNIFEGNISSHDTDPKQNGEFNSNLTNEVYKDNGLNDKEQINSSDKEVDKGLAGSKNVKVCKSRTSITKELKVIVLRKSKRIVKPRDILDLQKGGGKCSVSS